MALMVSVMTLVGLQVWRLRIPQFGAWKSRTAAVTLPILRLQME